MALRRPCTEDEIGRTPVRKTRPLCPPPPLLGTIPSATFKPSLSVVNSRVDRVRVWGSVFEVDWRAYSRTDVNTT